MIGRLAGRIGMKGDGQVLLDVRGVGYVVHVSDRTLAALPPVGEAAALWTELLVREDLLQLFGFLSVEDREWHRLLTGVQGVGPKAAMAILGTLGAPALARAIALGDWTTVKAAQGVGPKLAQRVVLELKGKAPAMMAMGGQPSASGGTVLLDDDAAPVEGSAVATPEHAAATAEALSALVNLGYGHGEAASAVAEESGAGRDLDTPALIRAALRRLAPKG